MAFGFEPRPVSATLALRPFSLLFGLDAAQLWPLTNLVLPAWLLLALLPKWRHTPALTIVPPLVHAAMYVLVIVSGQLDAPEGEAAPDFTSLEGVVRLFQDPSGVFAGWLHYLVFDLLVGRAIVQDALGREWTLLRHTLFVVPCLFGILLYGPTGFLLYTVISDCGLIGRVRQEPEHDLEARWRRLKAAPRGKLPAARA